MTASRPATVDPHLAPVALRPTVVLVALSVGWCGFGFQGVLVAPVLPLFAHRFDETTGITSYVLTSALLVAAIATPLLSRAADRFGLKAMMLVATGLLALGGIVAASSSSFLILVAGRSMQGAAAAMLPLGLALIRETFPEPVIRRSTSILGTSIGIPSGAGLVLAGLLVQGGNLSVVLWVSAGYGLLAFAAVLILVPDSPLRVASPLDVAGIVLLAIGLICLMLPLSEGPTWGWLSASTVALLFSAAVLLTVWVLVELRATAPLVDIRQFMKPPILSTSIATFVFGFASLIAFVATVTLVQVNRHQFGYGMSATVLQAGFYMLPTCIAQFLMAFVATRLNRRWSLRQLIIAGTVVGASGLAIFAVAHSHSWQVYLFSIIYGCGFGLSFACIPPRLVDTVPVLEMAAASATNAVLFNVSQVLGGAVLACAVGAATAPGAITPADSGYRFAGLIGAGVAFAGVAVFAKFSRSSQGADDASG